MTSISSSLPSWARLSDMGVAAQWWNDRRSAFPPACLSPQAVLTIVGVAVRQGHALLLTDIDFLQPSAYEAWLGDLHAAWEVALLGAAHATLAARTPDGTPCPSVGLVAANLCSQDVERLSWERAEEEDVATALLRLEASHAHALQSLFRGPVPGAEVQVAVFRELLLRLGVLAWAVERQVPWFAEAASAVVEEA